MSAEILDQNAAAIAAAVRDGRTTAQAMLDAARGRREATHAGKDGLNAVLAMQPGNLARELHRIAMPPLRPESALTAIAAQVWAAPRELHDDRALSTPVGISGMIDQLPPDSVVVEIGNHFCRRCRNNFVAVAECEASNTP